MDSYNKINNDPFKQFVKSKLADYKEEVPPSNWDKLESSLFAVQKTKTLHTKWIASSVAAFAAALIGVFFVFQNMNKEIPLYTSEHETIQTDKITKSFIAKKQAVEIEKTNDALIADNTPTSKNKQPVSSTVQKEKVIFEVSSDVSNDTSDSEVIIHTAEKKRKERKDKSNETDERAKQQLIQDFINEGNRSLDVSDENSRTKKRSRHSISLSGKSGLSSSQQTNTIPSTLRSSVSETYGKYTMSKMESFDEETQTKQVDSKSETNHMQPISFGLLTSFNLTTKLQVETGIVYTYLSSETKNKSTDFQNSEKVQFHYLGIPLNLNYSLLSVNKLDIFVTAGAMIEKDIDGKIKYYDEKKTSSINTIGYESERLSKIKQQNPQLSVAGGVGITYPIYDKTKLFGKVGGRYYIDANNEYKTYYSDEKFGLDIQLGIKFNF